MESNNDASVSEYMKHPLEHRWCFWFFTNEIRNKKNWLDNLRELTHFDTVEDYWCLYHHMKFPTQLRLGQDYAVFKQGISPTWEDEANKAGGRWFINLEKRAELMDSYWLDLVLLMIGENFESYNDIVCGVVVNVRAKNRISLWTRHTEEKSNMVIGKIIKNKLGIKFRLQFYPHDSNTVLYLC